MSMNMERHVKGADGTSTRRWPRASNEAGPRTIKDFLRRVFRRARHDGGVSISRRSKRVFQQHLLAKGTARTGRAGGSTPRRSARTALFTVEGASANDHLRDRPEPWRRTISASSLRPYRKKHYMQAGVGHYGPCFSGRRLGRSDLSLVRNTILAQRIAYFLGRGPPTLFAASPARQLVLRTFALLHLGAEASLSHPAGRPHFARLSGAYAQSSRHSNALASRAEGGA